MAARYDPGDDPGFVLIFDGKTLNGWDRDPTFWRAEDGEIIGQTTPQEGEQLLHLARRHC
jgi:hypothetical protein